MVSICTVSSFSVVLNYRAESVSHLKLPTIAFACKSDLPCRVDPKRAYALLGHYDTGLIDVTTTNPSGKQRIRSAFEFFFKTIFNDKREYILRLLYILTHSVFFRDSEWRVSRARHVAKSCVTRCVEFVSTMGCVSSIIGNPHCLFYRDGTFSLNLSNASTLTKASHTF